MFATTIFGLTGCGLLCLALVAAGLRPRGFPTRVRYALMLVAAVVLFVPLGDLSIAAYARGMTGDLSIPTLALAGSACVSSLRGRSLFAERDSNALLWLIAAGAVVLYPFALGFTPFDPYALGYGSIALVTVLLLVTLPAWRSGLNLVVLVIVAGGLAYLAGIYESRNLWDYLIDPLAAIYAVVRLGRRGIGRYFLRRQT